MSPNPLKELMEREGFTRESMGDQLGLKPDSIGKLLYQLDPEKAKTCMKIAEKRGHRDLVDDFARLAGLKPQGKINLADVTPAELTYLEQCLDIYRNPKTATAKLVPDFIRNTSTLQKSN